MSKTGCCVKVELLISQALIPSQDTVSLSLSKSKQKSDLEGTNLIKELIKRSQDT